MSAEQADRQRQGEALRRIRTMLGFTQREVADYVGVTAAAYGFWEAGNTELRLSDVRRLGELFEMPITTLISELGYAVESEVLTIGQWLDKRRASHLTDSPHKRMRPGGLRRVRGVQVSADHRGDDEIIGSYDGTSEHSFDKRHKKRIVTGFR